MATALHGVRLDAVVEELHAADAWRVADLGCGRGDLLMRLRADPAFRFLFGIDTDRRSLLEARMRLGIDWLQPEADCQVLLGSFEDGDWALPQVDAAVMLETIEHVDVGRLPRVERVVFERLRPRLVLVTTPNREYNVLHGMGPRERRHPGHRFEWDRRQFREWSAAVAARQGYTVRYRDLGPRDTLRGSSSQMAVFQRE